MDSDWLQQVYSDLKNGPGTDEQKQQVAQAALEIERVPESPYKEIVTRAFAAYVHSFGYVRTAGSFLDNLPQTVMEPRGDDDKMQGGRTMYQWREKWREIRVKRAAEQLDAGMEPEMVVAFVCSKEEWEDAVKRSWTKGVR